MTENKVIDFHNFDAKKKYDGFRERIYWTNGVRLLNGTQSI